MTAVPYAAAMTGLFVYVTCWIGFWLVHKYILAQFYSGLIPSCLGVLDTALWDKLCQRFVAGLLCVLMFPTNKLTL